MPLSGEAQRQRDAQRVVAGSPVTPAARAAQEYKQQMREQMDAAYDRAQSCDAACLTPDGSVPTTSLEAQLGKSLSSAEFAKKLKLVNPLLMVERSKRRPDRMGIYIRDGVSNLDDPDPYYRGVSFLMGFEAGIAPEFTVRHAEWKERYDRDTGTIQKVQVPTGELTMGWRSTLARLIQKRFATVEACDRIFGKPTRDSKNWWLLTA